MDFFEASLGRHHRHGLRERDHQLDAWRRTIGWFDRYLGSPR
jgi:dipeptidyl aminopeptidase/acylaminoacyl peptidase